MKENIDEDELPPVATVDEDGAITVLPLTEAYPDPSLDRVVMKIEDHGSAPIDGQPDFDKLREAYWELGSWLHHHDPDSGFSRGENDDE